MTIELIKATDCILRTRLHNTNNSLTTDKKGIELINKEDCSTSAKLTAEKMTKRQTGWAIRTGKINIPKWDKRYDCKYYDKPTKSCSEYPERHCSNCKKNRLLKTGYHWTHPDEY